MFNILFEDEYEVPPRFIAEMRRQAGLSQRELAAKLNRSQGHVHRMETRQRPIDLVEFCRIARAAGIEPSLAFGELMRRSALAGHSFRAEPEKAVAHGAS